MLEFIEEVKELKGLNDVCVVYLGKKGLIIEVLCGMGKLLVEECLCMGVLVNEVCEVI